MSGGLRQRDHAASAALGLSVAAIFFVGAFSVAHLMVSSQDGKDPLTSSLTPQAATALNHILNEPGQASGAADWPDAPDTLERFGLAERDRPQFLDYAKVRALWNGTEQADPTNGAPDYEEVKAALGLGPLDFHLRSYPVLMSVDDARWAPDQNLRVAYFAHYSKPLSPVALTPTTSLTSDRLNVTLEIQNRGAQDMVYVIAFSLGDKDRDRIVLTEERHTGLVRPGASERVSVDFRKLTSWDSSINGVKVVVNDARGQLVVNESGDGIGAFWLSATPPTDTTSPGNTYNHLVHAANVYYVTGQTVEFTLDHYKGDGKHVTGATGRYVLVGPNGREWVNESVALPSAKNAALTKSCANCTAVGNYTAILWSADLTKRHVDRVHVAAATMFDERTALSPTAVQEVATLRELVATFGGTLHDATTNPDGDVFSDDSNHARDMVALLDRYTTVVIGSEVEQANLAPEEVKNGLADWVDTRGGNLIVLGTYREESRWLRSVYGAMQQTAGGGISAPDATHPVLSAPEPLDYQRYLDRGRAWRIPHDQEFTHVLTRGSDQNSQQSTLAVSAPGAFESGTVVLTSYMPGALTNPHDPNEAKRLMHNMLNQGHSMLFIDYGPPVPSGVPVGSASRLAVVPHPNVPGVEVEVRLVLYLFG